MATELLSKYKVEQKQRIIGAFALVYWLLSFWWERFAFYDRVRTKSYAVIMSGETATYANIILKKGVI